MEKYPILLMEQFRRCENLIRRGRHHLEQHEIEMPPAQGKILSILLEEDGIGQKALAERLRIRPASLSELLQKLERAAYITRMPGEGDKRTMNIYCTEKGKARASHAQRADQQLSETLFIELDAQEQEQLCMLLEKLILSLENRFPDVRPPCHAHMAHGPGPHRGRGPMHARGRELPPHLRDGRPGPRHRHGEGRWMDAWDRAEDPRGGAWDGLPEEKGVWDGPPCPESARQKEREMPHAHPGEAKPGPDKALADPIPEIEEEPAETLDKREPAQNPKPQNEDTNQ